MWGTEEFLESLQQRLKEIDHSISHAEARLKDFYIERQEVLTAIANLEAERKDL